MASRTRLGAAVLTLLLLSAIVAGAHADEQVLTIYFMGTGLTNRMWNAEHDGCSYSGDWDCGFDHPETVATLYHFDEAFDLGCVPWASCSDSDYCSCSQTGGDIPTGTTHFKGSVNGFESKLVFQPDWWFHFTEPRRFLDGVLTTCTGECVTLNLVGFSRGGVSALYFADTVMEDATRRDRLKKINVFAFDPVPGDEDGLSAIQGDNLTLPSGDQYPDLEYVGIYAVDERFEHFAPAFPAPAVDQRFRFFRVRGAHETVIGNTYKDGKDGEDNDACGSGCNGACCDDPGGLEHVAASLRMFAVEMLGSSDWGHVRFRSPTANEAQYYGASNLDWYGDETGIEQLRDTLVDEIVEVDAYGDAAYRNMRESGPALEAYRNSDCETMTGGNARTYPRCAYYYEDEYDNEHNHPDCPACDLEEANQSIDFAVDAVPWTVASEEGIWNLISERGSLDVDGDLVDHADDNCPTTANADQADLDGDGVGSACDCDDQDPIVACSQCTDADGDGRQDCADSCIDADGDGYGAPGSAVAAPPLALTNVAEAADYRLVFTVEIPVNADFGDLAEVPYAVDNTALIPSTFDRVAYMLELGDHEQTQWVWVSMDAFTSDLPSLGVPHQATNDVVWQTLVTDMNVYASPEAPVTSGTGFLYGNIEIWHHGYTRDTGLGGILGSPDTYDWDDTWTGTLPNDFGSFQIHNWGAGETVLAVSAFDRADRDMSVGIGKQPQDEPDWTFADNAAEFITRRLHVLVADTNNGCPQDCDDWNAKCTIDCADSDGDGICASHDCNDGDPQAGTIELCGDGVDNDCDPTTPDLFDLDGDGATCDVDCDDLVPGCDSDCTDADGDGFCAAIDCDDGGMIWEPVDTVLLGMEKDGVIDELVLGWTGGQPPFDVYRSTSASDVTDAANHLGSTAESNWWDTPPPGAVHFYSVTGTCTCPEICDGLDNDCDGSIDEPDDVYQSPVDLPDPGFFDANCDGIDGDLARAVFVSAAGSDSNTGTSPGLPVRTIQRAMGVAGVTGRDQVLVEAGAYTGSMLMLKDGVGVHGNYVDAFTQRTTEPELTVYTASTPTAVSAADLVSPTVLEHLRLVSADATNPGESSYGIRATWSPGLVVRHCGVVAGAGAPGASASLAPEDGADGGAGGGGGPGACNNQSAPGAGGWRGASSCLNSGGLGGKGGEGGHWTGYSGTTGYLPYPVEGGGAGGAAGPFSGCDPGDGSNPDGGPGDPGPDGADGSDGAGGIGGSVLNGLWVGSAGMSGNDGAPGGGGGGGGGGAGQHNECACVLGIGCCCTDGAGNGGGGGGGGACGGGGGDGGQAGGGSFGLFVVHSHGLSILSSTIEGGNGGNGGAGVAGGNGGTGGAGGLGKSYCSDEIGDGADGGRGGDGGHGGAGGGGAGGSSIGILSYGDTGLVLSGNTFIIGSGGSGGASSGVPGSDGVSTEVYETALAQTWVFVTSTQGSGDLGGLAGADAQCQALADTAGLGGTFKAWLGDDTTSAADRLCHSDLPYVRTDGLQVAHDWTDLTDGTLDNPISVDEYGDDVGLRSVWTGTDHVGVMAGPKCGSWVTAAAVEDGRYGRTDRTNTSWTNYNDIPCDTQASLYCFEQPIICPTKRVFVTSTQGSGDLGGLAGADAQCQALADTAGLGGTFKAWLGDDTTSAADRLSHLDVPYVRTDGLQVAHDWTDLTDGTLDNPISVDEYGDDVGLRSVWTGTDPFGVIAGPKCGSWVTAAAAEDGRYGRTDRTNGSWTNYNDIPCDTQASLYCFEQ